MTDFGEPYKRCGTIIRSASGEYVARSWRPPGGPDYVGRIIAAVNAVAGMADPAADVEYLRAQAELAATACEWFAETLAAGDIDQRAIVLGPNVTARVMARRAAEGVRHALARSPAPAGPGAGVGCGREKGPGE